MSDQDVAYAKSAFAEALPDVEYRPNSAQPPHRHTGRRVAVLGATAVVIATSIFAVNATTSGAPAWSATPARLTASQTSTIDQQCRAAKSNAVVVGNGSAASSGAVSVSGGDVGGPTNSGPNAGQPGASQTSVGNLPLLLIDSRGEMAVALYGDASHTVMCTVDQKAGVSVGPDSGSWTPLAKGEYFSSSAVVGMITIGEQPTSGPAGMTRLLGRVSDDVTAMTVDVPGVGAVTATIDNGYYSVFIPSAMINSSASDAWPVHLTLADGSTRTVAMSGSGVTVGTLSCPSLTSRPVVSVQSGKGTPSCPPVNSR
jgi:hypothetical protein